MNRDVPIFDFSTSKVKTIVKKYIDTLVGLYWLDIRRCKDQRSLNQNAYMWGVVLQHVSAGMQEAWGENWTPDMAHEWCRDQFLRVPTVNHHTGEVTGHRTRSTTELDTAEFTTYLDQIIRFAGESLNTEIPEADAAYRAHLQTA